MSSTIQHFINLHIGVTASSHQRQTPLQELMKHIQVPEQITEWTSILLSNVRAKIQVNHELTDFTPVTPGIRQGCPLSMLLFTLAVDVLAKKLLAAPSICALALGSSTLKLQQYADDTTLVFTTSSEIKTAIHILNDFFNYLNLKINAKKATVISNNRLKVGSKLQISLKVGGTANVQKGLVILLLRLFMITWWPG